MGLDISHYKLIEVEADDSLMFLKDEIEFELAEDRYFPDDIYVDADVEAYWEFIAVFNNSEDLLSCQSVLRDRNDGYVNYQLLVSKDDEAYQKKIKVFEKQMGLVNFEKHKGKLTVQNESDKGITYEYLVYFGTLTRKVAYFEQAGYQRKGMRGKGFNEYFKNGKNYTNIEDFKILLKFIDTKSALYLENNIQDNFVNKFKQGKSILSISW